MPLNMPTLQAADEEASEERATHVERRHTSPGNALKARTNEEEVATTREEEVEAK